METLDWVSVPALPAPKHAEPVTANGWGFMVAALLLEPGLGAAGLSGPADPLADT